MTNDAHRPVVGWIGLGEMGLPMAGNLARAGFSVLALDRDPAPMASAAALGVRTAASLAELVEQADTIVTMLRTGAQTEALLLGDDGVAAALAAAGVGPRDVVVMSTMDPVSMEALAAAAAERGLTVVDAPVSGGVRGAEAATLAIMACGPAAALDRARPMLDVLGARTYPFGERPGAGQAAKLANQVMMAVAIAGTYEGLALARDYGVDEAMTIEAVGAGTGASWPLAHWDWMRSLWEEYERDNALDILDKDLRAVVAAVATRDVDLPVTGAVFTRLTDLWDGARDEAARR